MCKYWYWISLAFVAAFFVSSHGSEAAKDHKVYLPVVRSLSQEDKTTQWLTRYSDETALALLFYWEVAPIRDSTGERLHPLVIEAVSRKWNDFCVNRPRDVCVRSFWMYYQPFLQLEWADKNLPTYFELAYWDAAELVVSQSITVDGQYNEFADTPTQWFTANNNDNPNLILLLDSAEIGSNPDQIHLKWKAQHGGTDYLFAVMSVRQQQHFCAGGNCTRVK